MCDIEAEGGGFWRGVLAGDKLLSCLFVSDEAFHVSEECRMLDYHIEALLCVRENGRPLVLKHTTA